MLNNYNYVQTSRVTIACKKDEPVLKAPSKQGQGGFKCMQAHNHMQRGYFFFIYNLDAKNSQETNSLLHTATNSCPHDKVVYLYQQISSCSSNCAHEDHGIPKSLP